MHFTDDERQSLTATRCLTRDEEGHEVLFGLTERETKRYMDYVRRGGSRLKAEREMHKQLDQRHQYARFEAIGIEQDPPWR